jgi:hypothetical protein
VTKASTVAEERKRGLIEQAGVEPCQVIPGVGGGTEAALGWSVLFWLFILMAHWLGR